MSAKNQASSKTDEAKVDVVEEEGGYFDSAIADIAEKLIIRAIPQMFQTGRYILGDTEDEKDRAHKRALSEASANGTHINHVKTTRNGKAVMVTRVGSMSSEIVPNSQGVFIKACKDGDIRQIEALLHFVDSDQRDEKGVTGLVWACAMNREASVAHMVKSKCFLDGRTHKGNTAIKVASKCGFAPIVAMLVKGGAEPNVPDNEGDTALFCAARMGYTEVIKELVQSPGLLVNRAGIQGYTALAEASLRGHYGVVSALIDGKASIDAQNTKGVSALHLATLKGHTKIALLLIKSGAALNLQTKKGNTPFMVAAQYERLDILGVLIKKDASLDSKNREGQSAIDVAPSSKVRSLINNGYKMREAQAMKRAEQGKAAQLRSELARQSNQQAVATSSTTTTTSSSDSKQTEDSKQ